jgi:hypothetical protein
MDSGQLLMYIGVAVLIIAVYVALVRWVLRINDIIFYLDKINEKLLKMEQEREKREQ